MSVINLDIKSQNALNQLNATNKALAAAKAQLESDSISDKQNMLSNLSSLITNLIESETTLKTNFSALVSKRTEFYENLLSTILGNYYLFLCNYYLKQYEQNQHALNIVDLSQTNSDFYELVTDTEIGLQILNNEDLYTGDNDTISSSYNLYVSEVAKKGEEFREYFDELKTYLGYSSLELDENGEISNFESVYSVVDHTLLMGTVMLLDENSETLDAEDTTDITKVSKISMSLELKSDILLEDGSSSYPYIIRNLSDMSKLNNAYNSSVYVSFGSNVTYTTAGTSVRLRGNINGNNHTLTLPVTTNVIYISGTVEDLVLEITAPSVVVYFSSVATTSNLYFLFDTASSSNIFTITGTTMSSSNFYIYNGATSGDLFVTCTFEEDTYGTCFSDLSSSGIRVNGATPTSDTVTGSTDDINLTATSVSYNYKEAGSTFSDTFSIDSTSGNTYSFVSENYSNNSIVTLQTSSGGYVIEISDMALPIDKTETVTSNGYTTTITYTEYVYPFVSDASMNIESISVDSDEAYDILKETSTGILRLLILLGIMSSLSNLNSSTLVHSDIEEYINTAIELKSLCTSLTDTLSGNTSSISTMLYASAYTFTYIEGQRESDDANYSTSYSSNLITYMNTISQYASNLLSSSSAELDEDDIFEYLEEYIEYGLQEVLNLSQGLTYSIKELDIEIDQYLTFFDSLIDAEDDFYTMISTVSNTLSGLSSLSSSTVSYVKYATFREYSLWRSMITKYIDEDEFTCLELYMVYELGLNSMKRFEIPETYKSNLTGLVNRLISSAYKKGLFTDTLLNTSMSITIGDTDVETISLNDNLKAFDYEKLLEVDYSIKVSSNAAYENISPQLITLVAELKKIDVMDMSSFLNIEDDFNRGKICNIIDLSLLKYLFKDGNDPESVYEKAREFSEVLYYGIQNFKTMIIQYHFSHLCQKIYDISNSYSSLLEFNVSGSEFSYSEVESRINKYIAAYIFKNFSEYSSDASIIRFIGNEDFYNDITNYGTEDIKFLTLTSAGTESEINAVIESLSENIADLWNGFISIFDASVTSD